MKNTNQGTVTVGDGRLYYEVAGSGETLVLCHAGFVDSGMWDGQWEEFSGFFRVIRFDMRDYGKSDRAQGPVSRRKDLEGLLDQLGIPRAVLVGCSMGGTVVLDFALAAPDRVEGLVLVSAGPSGFEMQGDPPPNLLAMIAAMQHGALAQVSELQLRLWVDGPFRQPEQVDPQVRQRAAEMNRIPVEHGTFRIETQPVDPLDPPAVARLNEIHVPTLIVAGALDHPEILRAAAVMEQGIPGARKVIIAGAAHVPNMEKPAEFNREVLSFLKDAGLCA
ncbi:MAG: alpha/beta fold hydrolase [Nitrososphaerales archaeon]